MFARRALECLTEPAADVAASDRRVGQLARASWLGSVARRAGELLDRAWADSRANAWGSWFMRELTPAPAASALRARGWTAVVAGLTAVGLQAIKPMPIGPLSWIAPTALACGGLLLIVAAGPVALALEDRRNRRRES